MTNTPTENIDKNDGTWPQTERAKQVFETKASRLQSQEEAEKETIQKDLKELQQQIDGTKNTSSQTPEITDDSIQAKETEKKIIQKDLEELKQEINGTKNTSSQTSETIDAAIQKLDTNVSKTIDDLGRPQAAEGLKTAFATIQQDIAKSDQDKNPIARGLGKIIKKLLWQ